MSQNVEITFECFPLRMVTRFDPPLDATEEMEARFKRIKHAVEKHGHHNTYYLHDVRCVYHLTNDEQVGTLEFTFEGTVLTDAEDKKTVNCDIEVRLDKETCDWITEPVVQWFAETVSRAVHVEFDRFIAAGDLEKAVERIKQLEAQTNSLGGFLEWGSNSVAKLIVGCGYLGSRVAKRWLENGEDVVGVVTSAPEADRLKSQGIRPIVADVTRPETLTGLPSADAVLFAVGHRRPSGVDPRTVHVDGLRAVLECLPYGVERFVYISSTSVYGQNDGSQVDEDSPCRPTSPGGKIRLEAERVLGDHPLGKNAIVLRLAGLYGRERLARKIELAASTDLPGAGWVNLIHVDDAAETVVCATEVADPPRTYVVSDGRPMQRSEYNRMLAELAARMPAMRTSTVRPITTRHPSNKRAKNDRMLCELGVELHYPNLAVFCRRFASRDG